MTGLTLFDVPPYQAHSETSLDAAISMSGKTKTLRELVFDALISKPMTDEELSVALDLAPNTCRPRRVELVRAGRIVEVGKRPTASGRSATVWAVTTNIGQS